MRFALIASARTGSDHLTTELGRRPDIWFHDEVFHPKKVFLRWPGWPHVNAPEDLEAELRALRGHDPDAFLERVYELNFDRPHVGLRIFERHHPSMLAKIIATPEIAKIVLIRANVLANYASKLVAEEVDAWGVLDQEKRAAVPPVRFESKKFLKHHDRYMSFYTRTLLRLNASEQAYCLIRFDELNNALLLDKLARFLAVTSAPGPSPAPRHVGGNSNILSRFSNPDEVREFLRAYGRLEWAHEGDVDFRPLARAGSEISA